MKNAWWFSLLRCPRCGGALKAGPSLAQCAACGPYPVLGGVPILVADPSGYCAAFHDSILAALAEHGLADRETVAVVQAFADGRTDAAERFSDDWTAHEAQRAPAPSLVEGVASPALKKLFEVAVQDGPARWLEQRMKTVDVALEVGCGAGMRSASLRGHSKRLLIGDFSLRAVLRARAHATQHDGAVAGVVLDAQALPVRRGSVDLLVAEHLVDLLDEPLHFLESARAVVRKQGRVLLATPEPSLGFGESDALVQLARRARFRVKEQCDGLPWLRVNSSRFIECYLVQALALVPS